MLDSTWTAIISIINVMAFVLLNALIIKPETAGQWIGYALAWCAGIAIVAVNRERHA